VIKKNENKIKKFEALLSSTLENPDLDESIESKLSSESNSCEENQDDELEIVRFMFLLTRFFISYVKIFSLLKD
jgi:hypothetical protein